MATEKYVAKLAHDRVFFGYDCALDLVCSTRAFAAELATMGRGGPPEPLTTAEVAAAPAAAALIEREHFDAAVRASLAHTGVDDDDDGGYAAASLAHAGVDDDDDGRISH